MKELVCRSSDYSRISIRSLNNYTSSRKTIGSFDNYGYCPSKEFIKMKKETIKKDEIKNTTEIIVRYKNKKKNSNNCESTNKLLNTLENYIYNKYST